MNQQPILDTILAFLKNKGIPHKLSPIADDCFLPGIMIVDGTLIIDQDKLSYPGDILHEAGHIAVTAPSERNTLSGKITGSPAEEMAAMAWSYAAAIALDIDPHIVFHPDGYKGGGAHLAEQYAAEAAGHNVCAPGVPMLQWFCMTQSFPNMDQWLRTLDDPTQALPNT
ncbi:hypothetical protein [Rubritalea tangerina]|uniref:IrrE N-terminal-like domain-containing protein n=1 Tax=Rubritalea tangerina TaxID=430798 RepID=A0ABW4ZF88_9BACT